MDKYLQYDHFDLSEDPSFIQWIKYAASDNQQHNWDNWLRSNPQMEDTVQEAKLLVTGMKFKVEHPTQAVQDNVWQKITSDIDKPIVNQGTPQRRRIIKLLSYGAVAAIGLVLLYVNLGTSFDTSINTNTGLNQVVSLPDGSSVELNVESLLEYNKQSWNKDRAVHLKGEAFFTVKKGSKFKVISPQGTVTVLGTSFNVFARDNQLFVECETGKVAVKASSKETILTPNQSVKVIDRQHTFVDDISGVDKRSAWRAGVFIYKDAKLVNVTRELERQFGLNIKMDKAMSNISYTGSFNKANQQNALTEVFYPLGLKTALDGNNVTVTK